MSLLTPIHLAINRRTFLRRGGAGLGLAALFSLLQRDLPASDGIHIDTWPGVMQPPQWPGKIRRVIHLYMAGGPSHLETLDYKPELARMHGKDMPESITKGQPIAQLQNQKLKCYGPQHAFLKFGQSGQEISEVFPHVGGIADDITIIRSMVTEAINHDPAHTYMNTGTTISGRPSMGAWLNYGLGSETENLPGFVVMTSVGKFGQSQPISSRQWHSGFLPSRFQGIELRSTGEPVLYVKNPKGVSEGRQRDVLQTVQAMNQLYNERVEDPEIATRISQYELAFRMQTSVPDLVDISNEPKSVLDLYGTRGGDGSFAANCLLARRLAERGVRFIQLYHRGWDHHGGVKKNVKGTAGEVDQASAALIKDLKQRGMLDETLVIWGGEFGRTPMAQGDGRDHHIKGYSLWMAGGGIKKGHAHGATDELGYHAAKDVVHINDLHATILHLFGVNHERLTFRFQGRDFRLTDVAGKVVTQVLA